MAEEEKKNDAPQEAPAEAKKEQKIGKFNKGDHMVHVFIQKGKKFVPFVDDDQ